MQQSTVLVPALQSNWLMMHVSMMIFSYGALLFGSLLAVTLLTLSYDLYPINPKFLMHISNASIYIGKQNSTIETIKTFAPYASASGAQREDLNEKKYEPEGPKVSSALSQIFPRYCATSELIYFDKYRKCLVNQIDYWSYRIIGMGFPLLTIGILSGAVWANEAWGSYWSWDPKETWALITWLIFAIYLHIRMTRGWNGKKPALVASLGFCVVWMCYLGVNLLGKGLHSYGWLS
jgi:cytochrome c-type biogenesis protein CcsB